MNKVILSVLSQDRPGIIAAVCGILYALDCNIENVSQTILQSEFSGIFIVTIPDSLSVADLQNRLTQETSPLGLHIYVKPMNQSAPLFDPKGCESFIITTRGPDRKGLVAGITSVIARYGVNVTNLYAVFKGGDDPNKNIMIYEVDIPDTTDQQKLDSELRQKASELGLQISIQHRNIFEAINRI